MGRLLTRYSPVRHSLNPERLSSFDLHVLSMPPAFILSQNQTLKFNCLKSLSLYQDNNGSIFVCYLFADLLFRSTYCYVVLILKLTEITFLFACLSNKISFLSYSVFKLPFAKLLLGAHSLAVVSLSIIPQTTTFVKRFFALF